MTWRSAALWAACLLVGAGVGVAAAGAGVYNTDVYLLAFLTCFVTCSAVCASAERQP